MAIFTETPNFSILHGMTLTFDLDLHALRSTNLNMTKIPQTSKNHLDQKSGQAYRVTLDETTVISI